MEEKSKTILGMGQPLATNSEYATEHNMNVAFGWLTFHFPCSIRLIEVKSLKQRDKPEEKSRHRKKAIGKMAKARDKATSIKLRSHPQEHNHDGAKAIRLVTP